MNTLEMNLTSIALFLFCHKNSFYVSVIAFSFMLRTTTAIFWIPLVLFDLLVRVKPSKFIRKMLPQALLVPILVTLVDSFFYGEFTFVPWNFTKINILHGISVQYGVHPWHWYTYSFLIPVAGIIGIFYMCKGVSNVFKFGSDVSKMIIVSTILTFVIYSILAHKEHRFMIPLTPMILAMMAIGKEKNDKFVDIFCLGNIIVGLYFSMIHQGAPHAIMRYLSSKTEVKGVLFLTHCHATPFYSDFHRDIPMRALECPPDLNGVKMPKEADLFDEKPLEWTKKEVDLKLYDHVVLFDKDEVLKDYLEENELRLCEKFFHTHFWEHHNAAYLLIYCRNK